MHVWVARLDDKLEIFDSEPVSVVVVKEGYSTRQWAHVNSNGDVVYDHKIGEITSPDIVNQFDKTKTDLIELAEGPFGHWFKDAYLFDEKYIDKLWETFYGDTPVVDIGNSFNTTPVVIDTIIRRLKKAERIDMYRLLGAAVFALFSGIFIGIGIMLCGA